MARLTGDKSSEGRFTHLLQPIRDLANNWNIDLASELEEYLDELENIHITFDGGETNLNFAEAALLIQGTACIYSRKVEYLYSLVYETLEALTQQKNLQKKSTSLTEDGEDKDVEIVGDDPSALDLDDLLVEGKNIDLDEEAEAERWRKEKLRQSTSQVSDLSLLLSEEGDHGKGFKVNSCMVHKSGALLMEPSHSDNLDMSLEPIAAKATSQDANSTPLLKDVDSDTESIGGDFGGHDFGDDMMDDVDEDLEQQNVPRRLEYNDKGEQVLSGIEGSESGTSETVLRQKSERSVAEVKNRRRNRKAVENDPWAMLDPHQSDGSKPKPYKKGRTTLRSFKKMNAKSFGADPFEENKASEKAQQVKEEKKAKLQLLVGVLWNSVEVASAGTCSVTLPSSKPNKGQRDAQCVLTVPLRGLVMKEFQYAFDWEKKRRASVRLVKMRTEAATGTLEDELSDDEDFESGPGGFDVDDDDDDQGGAGGFDFDIGAADEEEDRPDFENGCLPISLDAAFEAAPATYEDLCRQHVERFMRGAEEYLKVSQLSRRVSEWQEKLAPVLKEQESHGPFDIHQYGGKIVDRLEEEVKGLQEDDQQKAHSEIPIRFQRMVQGKDQYEICRLFLATLQLANNGNVLLEHDHGAQSAGSSTKRGHSHRQGSEEGDMVERMRAIEEIFSLRLLNKINPYEGLHDYQAPSVFSPLTADKSSAARTGKANKARKREKAQGATAVEGDMESENLRTAQLAV